MSVDERLFRRTVGSFATGIAVVSSRDPRTGQPVGLTVSAFSSVSLEPPQILVCIGKHSSTIEPLRANGHFAINVLGAAQKELSIRFASKSDDKWHGVDYSSGLGGVPLLTGTLATMECKLVSAVESGDHLVVFGQVERATHTVSGAPLVYYRGAYYDNLTAQIGAEDGGR